jgi:uncharacterized protein (DUF2225 family)
MFIVLMGEVGVYTEYRLPRSALVQKLSTGDYYIDSSKIMDKRPEHTTVALTDAIILPVDRESVVEYIREEPAIAMEIIRDLSIRLEDINTAYKKLAGHPYKDQSGAAGKEQESDNVPKLPQEGKTGSLRKEPGQKAAPATVPAPAAAAAPSQGSFNLFPQGHGTYELPVKCDESYLMNKTQTCPICKGSFTSITVKPSKLMLAGMDSDMRSRYKGIEPLYYEVLSCPHCHYSALSEMFDIPDKLKAEVRRELSALELSPDIKTGTDMDTYSVFTAYYLALLCAPKSFTKHQLVTGKLYYKLSRIYQDAGDKNMEDVMAKKALDEYRYAYESITVSPKQEQQICVILGELYLKQQDMKNAMSFFVEARGNREGAPALKKHAEDRIYDIRNIADAAAANQ